MPDGGTITVETAAATADGRPYVRLTIADTGVGIEPDALPLLFDPFFTTKPKGHGTGLGLATVFGIVNQSGGRISVASDPGRGAAFSILFPRVEDALPVPAPRRSRRTPAPGEIRVLIVDDDDLVRPLVARMVAAGGYEVDALGDPRAALALPERETGPYDVLVTDLSMPHLGGVELAHGLRAAWPALKVLYTSGHADRTADVGGPDARFLQKPFDADELLDALAELLGIRLSA
jgi:CheY-like chemotaxis protein